MSKLRKWLMKEERGGGSDGVDPEIKLFGRIIGASPDDADAEAGEENTDISGSRERAPPPCDQDGGVVCDSPGGGSAAVRQRPLAEVETLPEAGCDMGGSSHTNTAEEFEGPKLAMPTTRVGGSHSSSGVSDTTIPTRGAPSTTVQTADVIPDDGKKEEARAVIPQQQQGLKKPDRSAACPRCNSLDTKFCYYNNYNVNQPRHFCKNCQRYWTAGGTLRNVPVGAGRRRNNHGGLQTRHGAPLPDKTVVRPDSLDMAQQPKGPKPSPSKLLPVCDQVSPVPALSLRSIPNVSNISSCCRESVVSDDVTGAIHSSHTTVAATPQQFSGSSNFSGAGSQISKVGAPTGSRLLHKSSTHTASQHGISGMAEAAAAPGEVEKREPVEDLTQPAALADPGPPGNEVAMMAGNHLPPVCGGVFRPVPVPDGSVWTGVAAPFGLFNGSWPYGYNVGWSGLAPGTPGAPPGMMITGQPAVSGVTTTWPLPPSGVWSGVPWGSSLIPGMPPGMPSSPWMSPAWGGGWSLPWGAAAASLQAAAAASTAAASGPAVRSRLPIRPSVLGKQPRELPELERVEGALWAPKTVRLDNPGDVPRSSAWTALGVEKRHESTSGSNFKAFLPKTESRAADELGDGGDGTQLQS